MKKIIIGILSIMVVITFGINIYLLNNVLKGKNKVIDKPNSMISVMVEKDGKYERSTSSSWPSGEYELNKNLSKCENGSELKYDKKTKKVTMSTSKTDKCYLYFDITGTETNPYKIETIEDLVNLSNDVNDGNSYAGKYFVLTRDLDFLDKDSYEDSERIDYEDYNEDNNKESLLTELTTGSGFKPIGNSEAISFQGNINGNNYTIKNLHINIENLNSTNVGLIGYANNSKINNLIVDGYVYFKSKANIGGIVGAAKNTTIDNCVSNVYIKSDGLWSSGGILGASYDGAIIKNSINKGKIENSDNVGGIIGWISDSSTVIIENSINKGELINNIGQSIGGIIGRDDGANANITIKSSYNQGKITGDNCVGGLVGYVNGQLKINDSYNTGKVYRIGENTNNRGVGGLLGESLANASVNIKNSYNSGDVTDNPKLARVVIIGGLIGRNYSPVLIENSYNTGILKKEQTINYNNYDIDVGGIIGVSNSNTNTTKIINSYNLGMIENGNKTGGLVGYNYRCNELIINNSYNIGFIKTNIVGKKNDLLIGGLIGYNNSDHTLENNRTLILNSYNLGNINAKQTNGDSGNYGRIYSSGIIGLANGGGNIKIINAYNIGNIVSITTNTNVANGITYIYGTFSSILNLNNVYNLGTMQATTNYEIGFIKENNTIKTINNAYYNSEKTASNLTDENLIGMTETDMKNESFVAILNNNINNIKLNEIDTSLTDYTLRRWKLGEYGYPVFENE